MMMIIPSEIDRQYYITLYLEGGGGGVGGVLFCSIILKK